jgi:nucleotidyltransferase substrate binding protein (TIGR01987 family)
MDDVRWRQRLVHYGNALRLLRQAVALDRPLSELEMAGVAQWFEMAFELGWKTLKDYLDEAGVVALAGTPRDVIRAAAEARLVTDPEAWLDMLRLRNLLSHTYDAQIVAEGIASLRRRFLPELLRLHDNLQARPR